MTILVWAALPSDKVTPSHVVVAAHVHLDIPTQQEVT